MAETKIPETESSFGKGMDATLRRVLDILLIASLIATSLAFLRVNQFEGLKAPVLVVLMVLCILPSLLLRQGKHLKLRSLLLMLGLTSVVTMGMYTFGLASSVMIGIPYFLMCIAMFFSRLISGLALAAAALFLVFFAYLFVSGTVIAVDPTLESWNRDPRNWAITIFCILISSALLIWLFGTMRDFWKQSDMEISNTSRQYHTLVEYAPDAIMIYDLEDGRVITANSRASRLFKTTTDDLMNGGPMLRFSPEYQPSGESSHDLAVHYLKQARDGSHPSFEWTHLDAKGDEFYSETSLSRIPPFDRVLIRANIADISNRLADQKHREELQQQLEASRRLETIGQLTGGVAHDFNNLLAVILGNLELIQSECTDDELKSMIQPCIDATLRGADLTRNMLSYSRRAPLQPKVFDLNTLVRDTKNWTERTLPSSVEVDISLLARLWLVKADPSAAESALLNLILNACDAMPKGGKLTIQTSNIEVEQGDVDRQSDGLDVGRYVMVAVSDTGQGMSEEVLQHIFTPFFTTKPAGKGSGLGLPMVMGFMRQSGGTVQVYSEVGVGTTFKMYFPAMGTGDTDLDWSSQRDRTVSRSGGTHILLVEDEAEVLRVLTAMLEAAGYQVQAAHSGDQALEMYTSQGGFDLVLTDIVMPGELQGTHLARELRKIDPELPVVFMSGYASEATVRGNGLRAGDIRLMKPVMRRDLLAAVSRALGQAAGSQT